MKKSKILISIFMALFVLVNFSACAGTYYYTFEVENCSGHEIQIQNFTVDYNATSSINKSYVTITPSPNKVNNGEIERFGTTILPKFGNEDVKVSITYKGNSVKEASTAIINTGTPVRFKIKSDDSCEVKHVY